MLVMLSGTSAWAQTFTTDGETLTITVTNEASAAKVAEAMQGDKYSKVIVNGGGTINNEFVQSILYTQWSVNSKVETLDLGGVALEGGIVNKGFYIPLENDWRMNNLHVSTLVLPNNVTEIGQSAFETFMSPSKVVFPATLVKIGDKAFANSHLTSVDFPASLRWIGNEAFATAKKETINNVEVPITFKDIKLNDGLEYIGNSAFALGVNLDQKTLEIPASVKYIGPGAFTFRRYQDVYFYGDVAPMCPYGYATFAGLNMGTFNCEMLYANGGFNYYGESHPTRDNWSETGIANRENYVGNDNVYFAMLHFPGNSSNPSTYVDVTRSYDTWTNDKGEWPQNGECQITAPDGQSKINPGFKDTYLGAQMMWPSRLQWIYSYTQNSKGKNWDNTDYPSTNQLTSEQLALLRESGFQGSDEELNRIAYIGTRQFVLGNGDVKSQEHDYPLTVRGGRWYTLCVPFNMTKKMVDEVMGEGTQVCRFSSVERKFDNQASNHITLLFRNDVYKHKTEKINGEYEPFNTQAAAPADDDIVIYAHEAYMVKPTKTDDDPKAFVVDAYEPEVGSPLPTYVNAKNRTFINGQEQQAESDDCLYRFIGHYQSAARAKVSMPTNVYFFGRMKPTDQGKFWFYNGSSPVLWAANSCIVQTQEEEVGVEDAENFFNVKPGETSAAKQSSLFGEAVEDANTTGVTKVTIVAGEDEKVAVYSLNGQLVSRNGETNNLPKGVYVKNGKKFIIK